LTHNSPIITVGGRFLFFICLFARNWHFVFHISQCEERLVLTADTALMYVDTRGYLSGFDGS